MRCLYVAGTMTECLLRRGVRLWGVKNAVFVYAWYQNLVFLQVFQDIVEHGFSCLSLILG